MQIDPPSAETRSLSRFGPPASIGEPNT
jgi:hypothetical protein